MLGGADNPNGELPSYITGADNIAAFVPEHEKPNSIIIMLLSTTGSVATSFLNFFTTSSVRCIVASDGTWMEDIKYPRSSSGRKEEGNDAPSI